MKARTEECRWRFSQSSICADSGKVLQAAWETGCDQWCIDSESSPSRDGFRNGFCFCPYCGGPLILEIHKEVAA